MFSLNVPVKYSNTVYGTIRPLYISSRLFGYLPFSATITKPSSNKIYLTKVDHLIFIIHVLAFILCTVFNCCVKITSDLSKSDLLAKGVKFQLIFGSFISCIILVVELVCRTSCWNIIESINDFDLKVPTDTRNVSNKDFLHFLI